MDWKEMHKLYNAKDSTEDRFRNAVLDGLDKAARDSGLKNGWTDQDLPVLFKAVDAIRTICEARTTATAPTATAPEKQKFTVRRIVDAYAIYEAQVEATSAKEAAELARQNEDNYEWDQEPDVQTFDARSFVAVDADGCEIEGTSTGDL